LDLILFEKYLVLGDLDSELDFGAWELFGENRDD
jgi:hypothetical protein